MDFFKGIGDWFGGLFGKKKKEEQRPVMQQPAPQPQRPQMPQGMDFGFNPMAKPVAKTVYDKYGQPMSVMERPKWNDNPFQVAKPQQSALNEQKPLNQNAFNTPKPPEPKKPGFFDYLNPLGEHGLFGTKQQQNFKNAIKPVNDVLQGYEKWVDSSDKQEGFQWNDLGDYGRFIGKLPTSMVSGVVNAPEKIGQSISGVRNNDKGEVERLNLLQRGATALDAGIDIGGLGFGGSGTLLKAFGKEAAEQATKKGAKQLIKGIAKDALGEGLEEGVQTFLGDLSDDGKLNTNLSQYAQSVALGALGGGVMSGTGKAISGAKQAYNQAPITKLNQHVTNNPVLLDQMVSQAKTQARQDIDAQYSRQTQPVQNALAKVMADRQIDEAVKYKLANDEQAGQLQPAYDPVNRQLISYDQQDMAKLQQLHQQYGNDFTDHLNHHQEVIYNHLLDQTPRDQQGRYQDPITGETWIDEVISRDDGSQYVRVDNKIVNDYDDNSLIRQKIKQTIAEKFQGNQYQVGDTDILARVTGKTKNELSYKQRYMNDGDYRHKANMAGNLDEILNTMTDVRIVPNKKVTQKPYVDHYISGRTEVEIDGHLYYPRVDIEVSKNGQIIAYDIADIRSIKKEPRAEADNRSYMRETNSALDNQGSISDGNVAQSEQNVNDDAKYKLDDLDPVYKKLLANPSLKQHLHDSVRARWAEDQNSKVGDTAIDSDRLISSYTSRLTPEEYSRFDWDQAEDLIFDELSRLEKEHGFKPNERYQLNQTQSATEFIEQNLRQILGNEYELVTDRHQSNGKPLNAQGYADLKNHIVAVLDGKMNTSYHEAGHVVFNALSQVDAQIANKAIDSIINHYGAENLVATANKAGYGQATGRELDVNNEADVRYAAEEQLMNDFARYAEAKAKGRENYYAKTNNLSVRIKQWFDNVIAYLKDMVGRLDAAHDFMYRAERGDFAQLVDSQVRVERSELFGISEQLSPQVAYKIDPERALNTLKDFDDVLNGRKQSVVISNVSPQLAERIYQATGVVVNPNAEYELSRNNAIHINNRHIINQQDVNPLTEIDVAELPYVLENPDKIELAKKVRGLDRIRLHKVMNNGHIAVVEVIKKGNALNVVTYFNDTSSGRPNATMSPVDVRPETGQLQSTYLGDSVPQDPDNVKLKLTKNSKNNKTKLTYIETAGQNPDDFNAENYIADQVKAQKQSQKSGLGERLGNTMAQAKHHLLDDAVAYERYMTKDQKKVLKDELRNDIDKVRSSDMIAQQFIRDNGLAELGKLSTKELNQFQQYLIARRHAADLHKKGIKTGRDLNADLAIIAKYKSKFKNEEKIYRQFNKQLLGYMEQNGLISQELHAELSKNKAYTPYQRLMDDISSFTGHSQQLGNLDKERVIRSMKGSERTILNPIEATMANTMRIINEGQRNIAARKIAENVFSENRLKDGQKPRAGYGTLNFLENGEKVTYEVPKLVASEMKRLNRVLPEGVEKIVNVLSVPAKTLRAGATSLNPMFAASNLVRDQFQTTITGNLGTTLKGAPQALLATFGWGEKASALRAELRRQGIIGSEYRQTYGYKQGDLMKELQKEHKLTKKTVDRLRHPIDALNDLIGRTEYFTRAQQYFGTSGDVVAKSQAARNNTLNFSRGGEAVMVLNKIVPFLNAGVQGGRQITNQFAKRPVRTTLALAAWAGIAAAAKGFSESDDEKKQLYDRVSDYEKRTNLILFSDDAKYNPETGRIDGIIKIPIPQFLYPITDGINNTEGRPEDFLKVAGNLFEVFTGIDTENPVNQLTPTAVKPFVEAATNTNMFTGRDIVSEYDAEKAPEDKSAKYTTGVARFLSGLSGVDAPVIDNFIQAWGGGLGKDLAKTLTDNPDNAKDGGGVGQIVTEGGYRRFGSAGAKSQYEMAMESGDDLKKQLKNDTNFRNLSKEEQESVLKAITSDSKAIGGAFNKAERGEELKKSLSERQEELLQGFNSQQYIDQVLRGSKEINRERLYNENDYEYNEFKKEYDKNIEEDKYSTADKIKADKKLKKLEVGKDFPKEIRDLYGLSGEELRELVTTSQDGKKVLDEVLKYGDTLVKAGVAKKNKFRDKYGNLNIGERMERGSRGRRDSTKLPAIYKMPTSELLRGLRESKASGRFQTVKSYNISRGHSSRPMRRLNGGRTVSLKKR